MLYDVGRSDLLSDRFLALSRSITRRRGRRGGCVAAAAVDDVLARLRGTHEPGWYSGHPWQAFYSVFVLLSSANAIASEIPQRMVLSQDAIQCLRVHEFTA